MKPTPQQAATPQNTFDKRVSNLRPKLRNWNRSWALCLTTPHHTELRMLPRSLAHGEFSEFAAKREDLGSTRSSSGPMRQFSTLHSTIRSSELTESSLRPRLPRLNIPCLGLI